MAENGVELATAFVHIVPSTSGLGAALSDQMVSPVGSASKAAGDAMGGGMSKGLKMVGAAIAAIGITSFLKDSVDMAGKSAHSQAMLANQVNLTGASWDENAASITDLVKKQSDLSGVTKGDLRDGMMVLLRITGDVTDSQKMLAVSADLAANTGMDQASAAKLVAKAYLGQGTALQRTLGITLKGVSGMEAVALVSDRVAGSAQLQGDSWEGMQNKLTNSISAVKVSIGTALMPVMDTLVGATTKVVNGFMSMDASTRTTIATVGLAAVGIGYATYGLVSFRGALVTAGLVSAATSGALTSVAAGFMLVASGESVASVATLGFGAAVGAALPWVLAIGVGLAAATAGAAWLGSAMAGGGKGTAVLGDRLTALGYTLDADGNLLNAAGQRMYSTSVAADRMTGTMQDANGAFVATKYVLSDIDQAWENYLTAAGKVATATDNLTKARATSLPGSLAILQAEQDLKDAMGQVGSSAEDLSPTQQALADKYGILTSAIKGTSKEFALLKAEMSNSRTVGEGYVQSLITLTSAEATLAKDLKDKHATAAQIQADELAVGDAHRQVGVSLKQLADEYGKLTPKQITAAVKSHELTKEQGALFISAHKSGNEVGVLNGKLDKLPKSKKTSVTVNVNDSQYDTWLSKFSSVSRSLNLHVYGSGVPKKGKATGGIVSEPGIYPLAEKRREWVIDPLNANGPALITSAAQAAGMVASAGGGTTFAPTVNVYADSMADKRAIAEVVYAALSQVARDSHSLGGAR